MPADEDTPTGVDVEELLLDTEELLDTDELLEIDPALDETGLLDTEDDADVPASPPPATSGKQEQASRHRNALGEY